MKILLSAYACEPNRGSEPGVGWNWAIELAKLGHDVWVLTRANNQPVIEQEFQNKQQPQNLHFIYYDCPAWVHRFKKGNRGVHLYYLLWQWGAYKAAKAIHAREQFDVVQHVTFVSVRQPSFMGNLGIPFIFGPVAGGESTPWRLRFHYGLRGFMIDALRDIVNFCVRLDPLMWRTFRQADKIYVTSEQSKQLIPSCFHTKTQIQLAIGFEQHELENLVENINHSGFRVLYAGHFLYWKGMGIGLQAFAKLTQLVPNARLTMVGKGLDEQRWRNLADQLNIADKIDWISWVDRTELSQIYQNHDVFLFPSLHDSGGMVVLEALGHGLPVVCLGLGGPGVIVDESCGNKITVENKTEAQVVHEIGESLISLSCDQKKLMNLSAGAIIRTSQFSWEKVNGNTYNAKF